MKRGWLIITVDPDDGEEDIRFSRTEPHRWVNGEIIEIVYAEIQDESS